MLKNIIISREDIFHEVNISCQIPALIEKIVTRKIIAAATEEAGIKMELEELQKAADFFRFVNQLNSTEDTWIWLEKYNMSLDDFEEMIYINSLSNKFIKHLFADKIEPYFFSRQLDYADAIMYEVVLDDEDLALELFYAIKEGEMSFHDVAHQYVQDTELRRQCGYRGKVNRKDLKPEISAAVFAANPPQLLKPIVSAKGVHLILVEEIVQPELDDKLRSQILAELFSQWLKQQIDEVDIVKQLDSKKPDS
ncbi:MAG: peptidylprolyl isomerase [Hydrococcus sp. RM1_1_31]|nr:peptidylprolyl isomerase [Hydrococcus sp. RM1_1_31]